MAAEDIEYMPKRQLSQLDSLDQLRNIGPVCQADLNAAGISTPSQLIELGPEAAFLKMLQHRRSQDRSAKCCNAAYLYALYGAIHDIDWRDVPEAQKRRFKKLTAELRQTGQFG